MCVIIHKPAGVPLPDVDTFSQCWRANPDGAGVSWINRARNAVGVVKGMMDFDSFHKVATLMSSEDDVVYHFRIATSGGINPQMCHPFIVSESHKDVTELTGYTRFALAHNGILGPGTKDWSDTATFILHELAPAIRKDRYAVGKRVRKVFTTHVVTSRFVLQDGQTGVSERFGRWTLHNGMYFSNMHWNLWSSTEKPRTYTSVWDEWEEELYCPSCKGEMRCISTANNLYECETCAELTDGNGKVVGIWRHEDEAH